MFVFGKTPSVRRLCCVLLFALVSACVAVFPCAATQAAPQVTLKFAGQSPADHTATKFMNDIAKQVAEKTNGRIEIRVDDDGPGVPEADLKDLTRPFHRLDHSRARHTGGAGLGLAIVDALAQQHGGTLTLGNRDGGGLRASVDLPAA